MYQIVIPGGNYVYAVKKAKYSDSCIFRKISFTVVILSDINSKIYHKTIEILENFYIKLVKMALNTTYHLSIILFL